LQHLNKINSTKIKEKTVVQNIRGFITGQVKKSWIARICLNRKRWTIGTYKTEVEAAWSYNEAARENFGEFALLNIFSEQEIDFINVNGIKKSTNIRKSKYKNISYDSHNNKWRYTTYTNGKAKLSKRFNSEEEAYKELQIAIEVGA
jgi:hypothetical protein